MSEIEIETWGLTFILQLQLRQKSVYYNDIVIYVLYIFFGYVFAPFVAY